MRRIAVGALALLLGACLSAGPAGAFAPNVKVDPRTGLTDGERVLVAGAGWVAHSNLEINECSAEVWSGDQNACDFLVIVGTNRFGTPHKFASNIVIHAGAVGNGSCGTPGTRRSCAIQVIQLDQDGNPTATTALRRIVFAP